MKHNILTTNQISPHRFQRSALEPVETINRTRHWLALEPSCDQMLDIVLADWSKAAELGGRLPDGSAVSEENVLRLMELPRARPKGFKEILGFCLTFPLSCLRQSASAMVLYSRLRRQHPRDAQ